ncbi:MAG: bifunctional DNA primase/polymerase [Pseudomonadota bacterium]
MARGWAVVPVAPRGKRPLVPWRAFQDGLPGPEQVERWAARWPDANVGIVTGAASGLLVLDVDPRHGGAESLAAIEARHGALPGTVEAETGGGGRHLYFAHPGGERRNRAGLAPGLDLRGDGGLIVAPPSIHPSGRPYRWREGRAPGEAPLARPPVWLLAPRFGGEGPRGHPASYWQELVREGVAEGARNATLASFTGHLLWHGVDPDVAMELMLAWNRVRCRPPLSDDEVIRTVRSIERTHRREADGEP